MKDLSEWTKNFASKINEVQKELIEVEIFTAKFQTTQTLWNEYIEWCESLDERITLRELDTIGSNFSLKITQTSLGYIYVVEEAITGEKFDLTVYDLW